jgi:hypothetical protein
MATGTLFVRVSLLKLTRKANYGTTIMINTTKNPLKSGFFVVKHFLFNLMPFSGVKGTTDERFRIAECSNCNATADAHGTKSLCQKTTLHPEV